MALINCSECAMQISDQAHACPHCGFQLQDSSPPQQNVDGGSPSKSLGIYIILGVLLGLLGIHNFYAGYYGRGAAQLSITALLGSFYVGLIITGLWVLVELCTVRKDANGNMMRR
jgi:TM2 domain-containing membrane protein YozV